MKNNNDPTSKALRDRYARLLGLNNGHFHAEKIKKQRQGLWYMFLFLIFAMALGIWFLFDSLMENADTLNRTQAKTVHRQTTLKTFKSAPEPVAVLPTPEPAKARPSPLEDQTHESAASHQLSDSNSDP